MCATYHNNFDIVKELVKSGADVNLKEKHGKNALFYAVEGMNIEIAEYLIKCGYDVDYIDRYGESLLHKAVIQIKSLPMVIALFNGGVDLYVKNHNGQDFYDLSYKYVKKWVVKNIPDFLEERKLRNEAEKYNL